MTGTELHDFLQVIEDTAAVRMVDSVPLEAFIAQGAAHPGVLQVFDVSAQPGQPIWMLLEYCDLGTLQVQPRERSASAILHCNEKGVRNHLLQLSMPLRQCGWEGHSGWNPCRGALDFAAILACSEGLLFCSLTSRPSTVL